MSTKSLVRPSARLAALSLLSLAPVAAGCGDDAAPLGTGNVEVRLEAEETITAGIAAGAAEDEISDGWTVAFTKYVVAVGHVELARAATPDPHFHAETEYVVDLKALPPTGFLLARFEGVSAERWDEFSYELAAASATSTRDASVSQADFDEMVAGGLSYLVEGTLTKMGGESCVPGAACRPASSIAFRLGVPVPTVFSDCEAEEGAPGVAVAANTTTSVNATLPRRPPRSSARSRRARRRSSAGRSGSRTQTRTATTRSPARSSRPPTPRASSPRPTTRSPARPSRSSRAGTSCSRSSRRRATSRARASASGTARVTRTDPRDGPRWTASRPHGVAIAPQIHQQPHCGGAGPRLGSRPW